MNSMLNIQIRVLSQQAAAQIKSIQTQVTTLEKSVAGAGSATNKFNNALGLTNLEKFGKNLQWTGRQLEYNFTLPLGLAGYAATKWALENETAAVRVRKVYGDLEEDVSGELDALSKSFDLLSRRFGVTLKETTDIAASWAQAGAAGVALSKATRATMEAMIIGELDATRATQGLIAVQSAYRLNTEELHDALAKLNIVENQTSIEFQGLIEVIRRAGGAAATAGVDINHLSAMAATLVPAAGSASEAGRALRTIFSRLLTPTREATTILREMGIEVDDLSWMSMTAAGRLEHLALGFENLTQQQKSNVSTMLASRWQINKFDILMRDITLSLDESTRAQSTYAKALEATSDQERANAIYARELTEVLRSSPKAFQILTTNIKNSMAQAILPLLPVFISLLNLVRQAVDWFVALPDPIRKTALTFMLLLAAIGPITRYFGSFILLGTTLTRGLHILTRGVGALFSVFGFLGSSVSSVLGLFAGPLKFALGGLSTMFSGVAASLGSMVTFMGDVVIRSLRFFIGAVGRAAVVSAHYLATAIPAAASTAASGIATAFSAVAGFIGSVMTGIVTMTRNAMAWVSAIHSATGSVVSTVWATTVVGMKTLWGAWAKAFWAISAAIGRVWQAVSYGVLYAWVVVTEGIAALWKGLTGVAAAVGTAISKVWLAVSTASATAWAGFSNAVALVMRWTAAIVGAGGTAIAVAWQATTAFMAKVWAATLRAMRMLWIAFVASLKALPIVMATVMRITVGVWAAGFAALKALTLGFMAFMRLAMPALALIMSSPWTAVIMAATALVYFFHDEIVGGILKAFSYLPQGIQDILFSVIRMIKRFALAVYEWLSYLNPFARHSPSLVDNVRNGISTILSEYSRLSGIKRVIKDAIAAHYAFLAATGPASASYEAAKFQEQRDTITAVSPNAGPAVDNLIAQIKELRTSMGLVNEELREQENLLADMERVVNEQMAPYNEAIRENEMAQKRLRLEILKLEEAGESVDKLRDRMAALSGEIERLTNQREDLRLSGAGSEIIGGLDTQIADLEQQRKAIEGTTGPMEELQNSLDQLSLQGQILQLEKDITFDPQLQAIEAQRNKVDELKEAWRSIRDTVDELEGSLKGFATAASQALGSGGGGSGDGGLSSLDQFRAGAGADFEVPAGLAPPGLGREGGLFDIEQFNAELEEELSGVLGELGAFNMFEPFKDMWEATWSWIKENVGPFVLPVWNAIVSFWNNLSFTDLKNPFSIFGETSSGLDAVFGGMADVIDAFLGVMEKTWNFIVEVFGPVFEWLADEGKKFIDKIGGELEQWKPLWDDAVEAVTHVVNVIGYLLKYVLVPIFGVALGAILAIWKVVWPVLKHVIGPIFEGITGIIRSALQIVRGIITVVLNLINGDWGEAWRGLLTIIDGVWDMIFEVVSTVVGPIIGLVRGLIEGIVGFFQWLYDKLVGHSIIPDMINAIVWWFNFLIGAVKLVWDALWGAIKWTWDNVGKPVFNKLVEIVTGLSPIFTTLKNTVKTVWDTISDIIKGAWDNVISKVFTSMDTGIRAAGKVFFWLRDNVITPVWNTIKSVVTTAWNTIATVLESGVNFFISIFSLLASAVNTVSSALGLGFKLSTPNKIQITRILASGGSNPNPGIIPKEGAFASGGVVPLGTAGFTTRRPTAIVGEGSRIHPEYVIPTDPRWRGNALKLFEQLGTKLMAGGGTISDGGSILTNGLRNGAGGLYNSTVGTARAFWNFIGRIWDGIGEMKDFTKDMMTELVGWLTDWGKDKLIGFAKAVRDVAWDVGAVLNPVDDIVNIFRESGGIIPDLADGAIIRARPGGTLVRVGEGGKDEAVVPLPSNFGSGERNVNFYGDLSFPNITDPNDAEKFIENLEALA